MKKRYLLLGLSLIFILGGLYFTTTNAYKLLKGYYLYKSGKVEIQEVQKADMPKRTKLYEKRPEMGEEIGTLTIPTLNVTLPIFHGTDEDELERGIGHYKNSVLPGEKDNSVLSGHRDTVFRRLGEVKIGDELIVTTSAGTFTYKVRKIRIVDADNKTVIVPKPRATLTVTTCYPFSFIGDAPDRYILVANLVEDR